MAGYFFSETGRIRFRRVVSNTELREFFGLTEFRGASSVSFFQPIICVPKRTHRVFSQNSPSLPANSMRLSEFSSPKQYSWNSSPPVSYFWFLKTYSLSPKAGHPKAGRSDFRNQRFKPDTGKMRKMRTSLPPQENKGLRRLHRAKTRKMRKMRTRKHGKCGKCGWLALMWLALGDPHLSIFLLCAILWHTVGTKIIADPEKCFQVLRN